MDKKNVTVAVIIAVIVVLVLVVFGMSASVPKIDPNILLTIDDNEYSTDEFRKFMYIKNEANGDIDKVREDSELETLINEFGEMKLYVRAANSKYITVPSEKTEEFKKTYAEKASTFSKYGITEEDYVRYAEDSYKQDELSSKFSAYYELPEERYKEIFEYYSGDEQKTYSFRIMTFYYEENSGDESGEVSGETSGDATESGETSGDQEKEDRSRETVLATAEDVLGKVRSGDDFGELAKEHSSYRYTFKGSGYTLVNGDVEYATTPLLESKLGNEELYTKFKELKAGEVTDIVEDEEYNTLYFAKLEKIEDGFVGEGDKELREVLLMQHQQELVQEGITKYELNSAALMRLYYAD